MCVGRLKGGKSDLVHTRPLTFNDGEQRLEKSLSLFCFFFAQALAHTHDRGFVIFPAAADQLTKMSFFSSFLLEAIFAQQQRTCSFTVIPGVIKACLIFFSSSMEHRVSAFWT